jgi:transposase
MKNKQYKFIKVNGKTLIVGIDIGKSNHYGFFLTMSYESAKSFQFSNTREGFNLLIGKIKKFTQVNDIENVVIAVESTGNYWLPLAYYIHNNTNYTLVQVNGKHTKRFKDVTDNTPNKTDHKDPKVIAQVVLIGSSLRVNLPQGVKANVRELTRSRKAFQADRKRVVNRIHAILSLYFPEYLDLFKDISCKTSTFLLKNHPSPGSIIKLGLEPLIKELQKISRGRCNIKKAEELITAAFNTIGVRDGLESYQSMVLAYIVQIELFDTQISAVENQIKASLASLEEYYILRTIKGIGDITIATIISEIGEFSQFKTNKELLKFGGLNLIENSSGKHRGNRRISKVGNEHLRTSLYFLALRMVKKGGIYHEQYTMYVNKGMEKKKAIIAISRKLLRTIHSLIKNNQAFDYEHKIQYMKTAA